MGELVGQKLTPLAAARGVGAGRKPDVGADRVSPGADRRGGRRRLLAVVDAHVGEVAKVGLEEGSGAGVQRTSRA